MASGGTRAGARPRAGRGPSDSWEDRSLYDRCITRGLPAVMFPTIYNNNERIVQGPGYVAITYEMIHETRLIPLDGRPHAPAHFKMLMGDSRGHWEGDTLVIDTTNFTDRTNYRGSRRDAAPPGAARASTRACAMKSPSTTSTRS